jgi:1-acyl-sn-glycerol-3-phosphate acyltransferase
VLPAIPNPLVRLWFDWYCGHALRHHFHRVHLYGDVPFDPARSTLYVATHAGFWDPLVVNHLIRTRRRQPAYAMSELDAVRKHPFFRRVGAFTVDRTDRRDGLRAVRHAAELLNAGPSAVLVFPQAAVRPTDERPIRFERGVERILSLAPAADVVVVALRYEFWTDQRPELLVDVSAGTTRTAEGLRRQLTDRMDALAAAGRAYRAGDQILVEGRPSISDWAQRLPRWRRG